MKYYDNSGSGEVLQGESLHECVHETTERDIEAKGMKREQRVGEAKRAKEREEYRRRGKRRKKAK